MLDAIGNTALVNLRKVVPPECGTVAVKLEFQNPTGSMKDRMAIAAIAHAEADGRLKPGDTVVEYTGGSTGTCARRRRRRHRFRSFAGTSTGANVCAAIQFARNLGPSSTVLTLAIDSGLKYLSTDLYRLT